MRQLTQDNIFQFALYFLLAAGIAWCTGDSPTGSPSRDGHYLNTFIKTYQIQDRLKKRQLTAAEYDKLARFAFNTFNDEVYYLQQWVKIRDEAQQRLERQGKVSTPEDLRKHPNYVDYFDGRSRTPVVFFRLSDLNSGIRMGASNPDVAVFMHTISVSYKTKAEYRLRMRYILRGPLLVDERQGDTGPYFVWQNFKKYKNAAWLADVKEVYKWPVLADLERLGYDPSTIEHEIDVFDQRPSQEAYKNLVETKLKQLLKNNVRYLSQFDSERGEKRLNAYGFMLSPIDGRAPADSEGWFQAPVFATYDKDTKRLIPELYIFDGQSRPTLDRLQLKLIAYDSGTSALVPQAIVRPIRVVDSVQFKTVYKIPSTVARLGAFEFADYGPVPYRQKRLRVSERSTSSALLFNQRRPLGHPFTTPFMVSEEIQVPRKALLRNSAQVDSPASRTHSNVLQEKSTRPDDASIATSSHHKEIPVEEVGDKTPSGLNQKTPVHKDLKYASFLVDRSPIRDPSQLPPLLPEAKAKPLPWTSSHNTPNSVPATPHTSPKQLKPIFPQHFAELGPKDATQTQDTQPDFKPVSPPEVREAQALHFASSPEKKAYESVPSPSGHQVQFQAAHHALSPSLEFDEPFSLWGPQAPPVEEAYEPLPSSHGYQDFYYTTPPYHHATGPLPTPWGRQPFSYSPLPVMPQHDSSTRWPSVHRSVDEQVEHPSYEQPGGSFLSALETHLTPGWVWERPSLHHASPPLTDLPEQVSEQESQNPVNGALEDHLKPVLHDTWRWPQPRL